MGIADIFPFLLIFLLFIAFGTQIFRTKKILLFARSLFFISVVIVLAYLTYVSYLQYSAFKNGPLGLTIGTVDGLIWFFGYIRLHYLNEYLLSLIVALLLIFVADYFNRKRGKIFFEDDESYIASACIFLVGYPSFLFYVPIMLVLPALVSAIFMRRGERLPLYYFWAPTAIVVLLAVHFWAGQQTWWNSFRF